MTTYADLLYDTAEMLRKQAQVQKQQGKHHLASANELQAQKIREALRTRSTYPAMSTEDVEQIKARYDPYPSDAQRGMLQDIRALADSHEAIRRERDTAESIAERLTLGYEPIDGEELGWTWLLSQGLGHIDRMTNDQIDWFKRHKA
jgi:hypothetical protein